MAIVERNVTFTAPFYSGSGRPCAEYIKALAGAIASSFADMGVDITRQVTIDTIPTSARKSSYAYEENLYVMDGHFHFSGSNSSSSCSARIDYENSSRKWTYLLGVEPDFMSNTEMQMFSLTVIAKDSEFLLLVTQPLVGKFLNGMIIDAYKAFGVFDFDNYKAGTKSQYAFTASKDYIFEHTMSAGVSGLSAREISKIYSEDGDKIGMSDFINSDLTIGSKSVKTLSSFYEGKITNSFGTFLCFGKIAIEI